MCSFLISSSRLTTPGRAAVTRSWDTSDLVDFKKRVRIETSCSPDCCSVEYLVYVRYRAVFRIINEMFRQLDIAVLGCLTLAPDQSWLETTPIPISRTAARESSLCSYGHRSSFGENRYRLNAKFGFGSGSRGFLWLLTRSNISL